MIWGDFRQPEHGECAQLAPLGSDIGLATRQARGKVADLNRC